MGRTLGPLGTDGRPKTVQWRVVQCGAETNKRQTWFNVEPKQIDENQPPAIRRGLLLALVAKFLFSSNFTKSADMSISPRFIHEETAAGFWRWDQMDRWSRHLFWRKSSSFFRWGSFSGPYDRN